MIRRLAPPLAVTLAALALTAAPADPQMAVMPQNPPIVSFNPTLIISAFTIMVPAQVVLGDTLICQVKPAANLADVLPPLRAAKLKFRLRTPKGVKDFGPFDLAMDGAGGISLSSFDDTFAEYVVTDSGDYAFQATLVATERIGGQDLTVEFPERRSTAGTGGGGDTTDDDGPATNEPGAPAGTPLDIEYAKIMIQTREGAPYIEEDRPYTFVADMSKVKFVSHVSIDDAKRHLVEKYFQNPPYTPVPAQPEEIGGGVDAANFVYRWIARDPNGAELPGSTPAQQAPVIGPPPLPDPPPNPLPPPIPAVASIPDFPITFEHPSEPRKCTVEFNGSFDIVKFKFTYDVAGCGGLQKDLSMIRARFDEFVQTLPPGIEKVLSDEIQPKVGVSIDDNKMQPPTAVIFYGQAHVVYFSEKTEEVTPQILDEDARSRIILRDLGGMPRKVVTKRMRLFFHPDMKPWTLGQFTSPRERKQNQAARMTFPVFDTTAPEIQFVTEEGSLASHGDYKVTTGDMKLIRVRVKDNNRWARIRTPYLYYETEPSAGRKENWCGAPLRMETIDGVSPPPFLGAEGNNFRWQAFAPVPVNYIGPRCVKWYVDAYDGSNHPRFSGADYAGRAKRPGNHNRGRMNYEVQRGEWEVVSDEVGTFSLYDNDRPNIIARVFEVVDGKPRFVCEFAAAEDWRTPDFYDAVNAGSTNYAGIIPDDGVLASAGFLPPSSNAIFTFFMDRNPELKDRILRAEPFQVADAAGVKFHFRTAESGKAVIFEDKHYLIAFDITDNVDYAASANGIERRENMEKFDKVRWQLFDPESDRRMDTLAEISFGPDGRATNAEGWYLGPRDPENDAIGSRREIPMFEYVFHAPKKERGDGPPPFLRFAATDRQGHERFIKISFNVLDVKTEFRNLEGKIERSRERETKR